MRGHQALIDRRIRGWHPSCVFVSDGGDGLKAWRDWPQWSTHAHVEIEPKDRPKRLDLRFAYGLIVHLDAADEPRLQALEAAFLDAGAARVIGMVYRPGREGPECAVMRDTDTEGVAEWRNG